MQCPSCQYENPPGVKFCGECGAKLQAVCPACKAANPSTTKFCGECGERLEAVVPAPAPAPLPAASDGLPVAPSAAPRPAVSVTPAPESYTPKHLAERILTSRAALEGERKQVTVLFADLKGSTELIESLDPEEARILLDGVLQVMMEAVHSYEGT